VDYLMPTGTNDVYSRAPTVRLRFGVMRPFISIVGDQPELHAGFALSGRQGERDRPDALGQPFLTAQGQKDNAFDTTLRIGLDSQPEYQTVSDITAQRQGELLRFSLLPAERANRRIVC
jgi:hypothetical protein